jgi:transposase InsO family protein
LKSLEIIKKAISFKNRKKGAKLIKMTLENSFEINYNLKRIRRITNKYGILCPIRKPNPYKKIAKATKEHSVVKNIVNRKFRNEIPGKVLLTDITYLNTVGGRVYLSTILDASTNEILAHNLSKSLELELATTTIEKLMRNRKFKLSKNAIIHSDQGSHYTSPIFQRLLKKKGLTQSMSRRGNCWDNAPQESFFGHLKDESNIKECKTFKELEVEINDYMKYYNKYRCQWNLKKMTPVQYRNHLLKLA